MNVQRATDGRPRHYLSSVNPDDRSAVCSVCGPTRIQKRNATDWRCTNSRRDRSHRMHAGTYCTRCGYSPEDKRVLDVHHIDGDRLNNTPGNLKTLCANCHREEHLP